MAPRSVVIVGAGLAGARCAETLRAEGYDGALTWSATSSCRRTSGPPSPRSTSRAGRRSTSSSFARGRPGPSNRSSSGWGSVSSTSIPRAERP